MSDFQDLVLCQKKHKYKILTASPGGLLINSGTFIAYLFSGLKPVCLFLFFPITSTAKDIEKIICHQG